MNRSIFWHIAYPTKEEHVLQWLQPLPSKRKISTEANIDVSKSFMFMIPMTNLYSETMYLLFESDIPLENPLYTSFEAHPMLQHLLSTLFLKQQSITLYIPLEKVEQVNWYEPLVNKNGQSSEWLARQGLVWNSHCKICNSTSRPIYYFVNKCVLQKKDEQHGDERVGTISSIFLGTVRIQ